MFDKVLKKAILKTREELHSQVQKDYQERIIPDDVIITSDIPYMSGQYHGIDMYVPKNMKSNMPALIDIHGGGLVMGIKEQNYDFCVNMARAGYIVFAMDYSLVPEVGVLTQLQEIRCACDVINDKLQGMEQFGGSIYAVGDSAGGFLLMYTLAIKGSANISSAYGISPIPFEVKAATFQNAMFYSTRKDKIGLLTKYFYGKGYKKKPFYKYVNPENEELINSLPPFMMFTTVNDFLRKYTVDFGKAVKTVRTDVVYKDYDYKSMEHAFAATKPNMPECQMVNKDMLDYFSIYDDMTNK